MIEFKELSEQMIKMQNTLIRYDHFSDCPRQEIQVRRSRRRIFQIPERFSKNHTINSLPCHGREDPQHAPTTQPSRSLSQVLSKTPSGAVKHAGNQQQHMDADDVTVRRLNTRFCVRNRCWSGVVCPQIFPCSCKF